PDADDTPGAMLALINLKHAVSQPLNDGIRHEGLEDKSHFIALGRGATWLLHLQNGDGGWPTFCRGWGTLPFDRSAPDLTAHAIRAWLAWRPYCEKSLAAAIDDALRNAVAYILKSIQPDGSWVPLWFGNQFAPN